MRKFKVGDWVRCQLIREPKVITGWVSEAVGRDEYIVHVAEPIEGKSRALFSEYALTKADVP